MLPGKTGENSAPYRQLQIQKLVGPERFELSTNGLKVRTGLFW